MSRDDLRRVALERRLRQVADSVKQQLPSGVGFLLVAFDVGGPGNLAYVSTGNREDCVKMLHELIGYLEGRTN